MAAGGDQTAPARGAVPTAPAVRVADQTGAPMAGVPVTFAVAAGGGAVTGAAATTDAQGIARVGAWTLGPAVGPNRLTATVAAGAGGARTALTAPIDAQARLPRWTVLVYMAADNNLALAGVGDIDEMEAAGASADVQVVVQAEFNPDEFRLRNCDASCANLPNFDTFRYAVSGRGPHRTGPDAPVTGIGNRNMIDPAELRDFVQWGKQTYPSERTALVLWNHGGGYTGLLEDLTSSGSRLMTTAELRQALEGTGGVDVLDFDMCLMGAYETLVQLTGLAKVAVFSQETEPGEGDPYDTMLRALAQNPGADARAFGKIIVDAYHASYANSASSTTKSAYDLAGFGALDAALGTLAASLRADVGTLGTAIGTAAASSQKFEFAQLTDLGDFLDSLEARTADATLRGQIAAVRTAAANPAFRLATRARTGTGRDVNDVARSTGLHIVMPSGQPFDALADRGPASFDAYRALHPDRPWTLFLESWLGGGAPQRDYVDQGENRWEMYLMWDRNAVAQQADVDLWILEPDGKLYIPWMGTVTPNGHLTNDSVEESTFYEGFLTNRYVQQGRYTLYANLYADPNGFRPAYNLAYRQGQGGDFALLYGNDEIPRLTMERSWRADPDATLDRADANAYTDLQKVATLTIEAPAPGLAARTAAAHAAAAGRPTRDPRTGVLRDPRRDDPRAPRAAGRLAAGAGPAAGGVRAAAPAPRITRAQLETIRRWQLEHPRAKGAAIAASRAARRGRDVAPAPRGLPRLAPGAR